MTEIVLIQMFCLTVGSKQIKKMKTENTIAPSYHLKVRSTQDKRVLFFSCLGISIISSCLGKVKVFSDNSDLTIPVQSFHENNI